MNLVQRQTPEQIKSRSRHNLRKAAVGVAACVGTLFGVSAGATAVAADRLDKNQEQFAQDLFGARVNNSDDIYQRVSVLQGDPAVHKPRTAEAEWHVRREQPAPEQTGVDWKVPLGAIGGASVVSAGALLLVGAAGYRRQRRKSDGEIDHETTDEYAYFDFEERLATDAGDLDTGLTNLETGHDAHDTDLTALDQVATTVLIRARLQSPLNTAHMNALEQNGRNPLEGLNYSSPETYHTLSAQGQPASVAILPILPAQY